MNDRLKRLGSAFLAVGGSVILSIVLAIVLRMVGLGQYAFIVVMIVFVAVRWAISEFRGKGKRPSDGNDQFQ